MHNRALKSGRPQPSEIPTRSWANQSSGGFPMTTNVATTTPMVATHINAASSATSGQVATPAATPTRAIIQVLVASCYRPITVYEFLQIKEAYPDQVVLCEVLARFKQNGYAVGRVLESRLLPARLEAVRLSGARETTKDRSEERRVG